MTTTPDIQCSRCRRPGDQESDEFAWWEVEMDGVTLICHGCLTWAEEQAIADDAVEFGKLVQAEIDHGGGE